MRDRLTALRDSCRQPSPPTWNRDTPLQRSRTFGLIASLAGCCGHSQAQSWSVHDVVQTSTPWLAALLAMVMLFMMAYGLRQALFAWHRMLVRPRNPYAGVVHAPWPLITVFVAAHNEEAVIADNLQALVNSDYPIGRMHIVVVNDRSNDATQSIVERWVQRYPQRIEAFHRRQGKPGKAAALKDAMPRARGDIVLIFDADYTPAPGLIRQLVVPFLDPQVGAVMGRVVPRNAGTNLLTRLLELERSAGYQVDQQARMNLRSTPQYGGTVGGVRLSALRSVGGWHDDVLAEDTDITIRLLVAGWKTVYSQQAACHEEVPQEWPVRLRQVQRWARGHHQVMLRQSLALLRSPHVGWRERVDGLMLLGLFLNQPMMMAGWLLVLALYYLRGLDALAQWVPASVLAAHALLGGLAVFMHTAFAVLLDGHRLRLRLLPLQMPAFLASLPVMTLALFSAVRDQLHPRELVWAKTRRYATQGRA